MVMKPQVARPFPIGDELESRSKLSVENSKHFRNGRWAEKLFDFVKRLHTSAMCVLVCAENSWEIDPFFHPGLFFGMFLFGIISGCLHVLFE